MLLVVMMERQKSETSTQIRLAPKRKLAGNGNLQGTQHTDSKKLTEEKGEVQHKASNVFQ